MAVLRAITFAMLLVVLSGCAGSAPASDSAAVWLVDDQRAQVDWFCEPAEDGGWDCVQDADRVANPQPLRLPQPLFAQPDTTGQGPPASIPPNPSPPQPPNAQVRNPPRHPSIPLYQELSYQPDQPTALTDLPSSFYAIQVIALSSKEDLEQFIVDNNLPAMSGALVEKGGELFYALLAGIYTDRETAERASLSLPEVFTAHQPWIRSLESLQAAILRAQQHPGDS
ncbi:MAG: hypothetical protein OXK76_06125 [Gammaproteobacteria bacterium]|nr:hypothetical protein [Gammaproteobacteria bacterium]